MTARGFNIDIPGKPLGKQRVKPSCRGDKVILYTPEQTVNYETYVKTLFLQRFPDWQPWGLEESISCTIYAYFSIPKTTKYKTNLMAQNIIYPNVKPDVDNIAKIILDSLNQIAYADDKNIVELTVVKKYTTGNPYVHVYMTSTRTPL